MQRDSLAVNTDACISSWSGPTGTLHQLEEAHTAAMAGLTVATTTSAPQPATRKRKQEVLDEDEWTEMLEQIVSRDFFPDVPKLENKLEWLQVRQGLQSAVCCLVDLRAGLTGDGAVQALRSSDPDALRQAQVNIAQRRAGLRTPIGATPLTGLASTLRTPAGFQTPATPMTEGARCALIHGLKMLCCSSQGISGG